MEYPLSLILCLVYVYLLVVIYILSGKWGFLKKLYDRKAGIVSLAALLVFLLVLGFAQDGGGMARTWVFTAILLIFASVTALQAIDNIRHFSLRTLPKAISHTAIAIVLIAALFGRGDKRDVYLTTRAGETVMVGEDEVGNPYPLPFRVTLREFVVEMHPDRPMIPKRFASDVHISSASREQDFVIEVNRPAKVGPWKIYQYSYEGKDSILECVRDPWYGAVGTGLWMLLIAAVAMIVFGSHKKEVRE